jgi:hypothetical protein
MQHLVKLGLTSGCEDASGIVDAKPWANIVCHAIICWGLMQIIIINISYVTPNCPKIYLLVML